MIEVGLKIISNKKVDNNEVILKNLTVSFYYFVLKFLCYYFILKYNISTKLHNFLALIESDEIKKLSSDILAFEYLYIYFNSSFYFC